MCDNGLPNKGLHCERTSDRNNLLMYFYLMCSLLHLHYTLGDSETSELSSCLNWSLFIRFIGVFSVTDTLRFNFILFLSFFFQIRLLTDIEPLEDQKRQRKKDLNCIQFQVTYLAHDAKNFFGKVKNYQVSCTNGFLLLL